MTNTRPGSKDSNIYTLRSMTATPKQVNPLTCPGFPKDIHGVSWCDQCYTMGKMCFELKDVYEWIRLKEEME